MIWSARHYMPFWGALMMALCLCTPADARSTDANIVLDISQREVSIRSGFTGEQLLLFGAILYPGGQQPRSGAARYDVIVEVEGPLKSVRVHEKQRVAGMWVNAASRDFRSVPGYYAVASTRPLEKILDPRNAFVYQIGVNNLAFSPSGAIDREIPRFEDGVSARNKGQDLYQQGKSMVEISDHVLYRARINLPASVPVGEYKIRAYLVTKGDVVATDTGKIAVQKVGFERGVEVAAEKYGFLYGLAAVLLSLSLGYLTGIFFRRFN